MTLVPQTVIPVASCDILSMITSMQHAMTNDIAAWDMRADARALVRALQTVDDDDELGMAGGDAYKLAYALEEGSSDDDVLNGMALLAQLGIIARHPDLVAKLTTRLYERTAAALVFGID
ncbi:MAG: hypothetical protein H0X37_13610 [Herpetosiphonaceae bacterium]|nr:hypothetical protein [Herpetosiphonaceae bacterium]